METQITTPPSVTIALWIPLMREVDRLERIAKAISPARHWSQSGRKSASSADADLRAARERLAAFESLYEMRGEWGSLKPEFQDILDASRDGR